ncbi:MAG: hypothetical protein RLZZ178_498 [Verrucomicrobiota bacterium]|jgi:hypothetical protein
MMHHDFFYQDYEFQDYPAEQPLPDRHNREQYVQEHGWKALQVHPITQTIRLFEIVYQKYPREMNYLDPLRRLMNVAYGAHPLFGAQETLRLAGLIRILSHVESEFEAMTLASDTFARYAFTLPEATSCAKHAAECAKLAGKPKPVIAAWRARAKQLRAYRKKIS